VQERQLSQRTEDMHATYNNRRQTKNEHFWQFLGRGFQLRYLNFQRRLDFVQYIFNNIYSTYACIQNSKNQCKKLNSLTSVLMALQLKL